MGYSPWGCKEADMTQQAPMHRNLAPGPVYLQIMLVYFRLIAGKKRAGGVGKNNKIHGDFPGSPAVKTLSSQS